MHKEHINVSRPVKQLKELLHQMDTLRTQVLDSDIEQFDKLTANARTNMMNAIKEYLGNKMHFLQVLHSYPVQVIYIYRNNNTYEIYRTAIKLTTFTT